MTISEKDRGAAALVRRMLESGGVKVGVLEQDAAREHTDEDGEDSGITIGELAAIHEFGLGVPRRSFLADWVTENQSEIVKLSVRGGRALVLGKMTIEQLLEQLGQWSVGSIQERMSNNIPPPLAPETIAAKGSSVALIDTGQLRSSITYQVDMKAAAGAL
jgi:hypothetical protein